MCHKVCSWKYYDIVFSCPVGRGASWNRKCVCITNIVAITAQCSCIIVHLHQVWWHRDIDHGCNVVQVSPLAGQEWPLNEKIKQNHLSAAKKALARIIYGHSKLRAISFFSHYLAPELWPLSLIALHSWENLKGISLVHKKFAVAAKCWDRERTYYIVNKMDTNIWWLHMEI